MVRFYGKATRNGWRHLYHYAQDGKLIRQVTDGKWEVRSLESVDEDKGVVFITATENSHIAPQPYRIKLDWHWVDTINYNAGHASIRSQSDKQSLHRFLE